MTEMIERVAKAIGKALSGLENQDAILTCGPRNELGTPFWKYYEKAAIAAIQAMREPTEEMMEAVDCGGDKKTWPSGQFHISGYKAMIEALLK